MENHRLELWQSTLQDGMLPITSILLNMTIRIWTEIIGAWILCAPWLHYGHYIYEPSGILTHNLTIKSRTQ